MQLKKTKIISVVSEKGGVGKTTTAFNLGAALKKEGNTVLIVDLDKQCNLKTQIETAISEQTGCVNLKNNTLSDSYLSLADEVIERVNRG